MLDSAKMFRASSSTSSTVRPIKILVRPVQPFEHALLVLRQIGDDAVQEQGRLVEQTLRRLDAFHHDAARHGVKLRILLRRKLAAGEDHHGNVGNLRFGLDGLQNVEAGHVRQAKIENHAIDVAGPQKIERLAARAGGNDLDVVVAEQRRNADLLGFVVLHDEQALAAQPGKLLDPRHRGLHAFGGRRLGDEGKGAARQAVLAVFLQRHDLHRNMARDRIVLELAEHVPAQHVGQEDVERNGGRPILKREFDRIVAAHRDQNLEVLVMGEIDKDARIMRIVLDDQEHAIARRDLRPVVENRLDNMFRQVGDAEAALRVPARP